MTALPEGWSRKRWGDLVTLEYGKGLRDYRDGNGQVPVFGTNGPVGWTETEPLCKEAGVIVGRKGAYRGIHYSARPFYVIDTAFYLNPTVDLDRRWAYYELLTHDINGMDSGSAIPSTSRPSFYAMPVNVPPLWEQRAIADVLGALDDKIESNDRLGRCINAVLEAEFIQVTAGTRNAPATSALTVRVGSPFAGDLFSVPGSGRPLIRIRDLKTFDPQIWTVEHRVDEKVIRPGDVVVGMDAEFRSTLWLAPPGLLNQRVCQFVPNAGVARAFALLAIRPDLEFFEQSKSGTTVIHLNKADIDRFVVPSLSTDEHLRFSGATEPLVDRWVAAALESGSLRTLRDALLPELLSGRLQVPVAEDLVQAAT